MDKNEGTQNPQEVEESQEKRELLALVAKFKNYWEDPMEGSREKAREKREKAKRNVYGEVLEIAVQNSAWEHFSRVGIQLDHNDPRNFGFDASAMPNAPTVSYSSLDGAVSRYFPDKRRIVIDDSKLGASIKDQRLAVILSLLLGGNLHALMYRLQQGKEETTVPVQKVSVAAHEAEHHIQHYLNPERRVAFMYPGGEENKKLLFFDEIGAFTAENPLLQLNEEMLKKLVLKYHKTYDLSEPIEEGAVARISQGLTCARAFGKSEWNICSDLAQDETGRARNFVGRMEVIDAWNKQGEERREIVDSYVNGIKERCENLKQQVREKVAQLLNAQAQTQ